MARRWREAPASASLPFELDAENGGIIATRRFDREVQDVYTFEVKVTDLLDRARSSVASVQVRIGDVNDNQPQFVFPSSSNSSVSVSNRVAVGNAIFSVIARDDDVGRNANVTYALQDLTSPEAPHFRISSLYGTVTVARDLQTISYEEVELRLTIQDGGSPSLMTSRSYVVIVDSRIAHADGQAGEVSSGSGDGGDSVTLVAAVSVVCVIVTVGVGIAVVVVWLKYRRKPKPKLSDEPYESEQTHFDKVPSDSLVSEVVTSQRVRAHQSCPWRRAVLASVVRVASLN